MLKSPLSHVSLDIVYHRREGTLYVICTSLISVCYLIVCDIISDRIRLV